MATLDGSDIQQNCISISSGIASFGAGGVNPQWIPILPTPLVINPETLWFAMPTGYSASTASYDAILKISDNTNNLTLTGVALAQGYQDSLNLNNHASSNHIVGDYSTTGTQGLRSITIKGGSSNNIIAGTIHQHGSNCDLRLGDWSDECYDYSENNDLSGITMADGSAVKVILIRVKGTKLPTNVKILWLRSIGLDIYWWLKWTVRKCLGIKIGEVGPSFLP